MCRRLIAAHEANYHVKCLVSLYNEVRYADAKTVEPDSDRMNHAVALAELVNSSDEALMDALTAPALMMADPSVLLEQLGTIVTRRDHSTKPKYWILRYCPDL